MKILAVGDVVGRPGRRILQAFLPALRAEYQIDFCFANGENASGGLGLDEKTAAEILAAGVDAITLGNHTFAKRKTETLLSADLPIIRPVNGPSSWPGVGYKIFDCRVPVCLISLHGRVFMDAFDDPFQTIDRVLSRLAREEKPRIVLVDFHAEATAEKVALGHFLTDRVSAVLGTHTHVATRDETILGNGTAYITDLGMTGPENSVIGMNIASSLRRFAERLPSRFEVAEGPAKLEGVVVEISDYSGKARSIRPVRVREEQ
jgi:metallophosphoesterase (TIGR00282 family)